MSEKTANELFEEYRYLAIRIANKLPEDKSLSAEDLQQEALLALWELCLNKDAKVLSDSSTGVYVDLYYKLLSRKRALMPIPKKVYAELQAIRAVIEALQNEGLPATDSNIAYRLNVPAEHVRTILSNTHMLLDTAHDELDTDDMDIERVLEAVQNHDNGDIVMQRLCGATYRDIAAREGITHEGARQRYRTALKAVREELGVGAD